MKKLLTGLFLMMVTAIAFALPSPQQIEDAMANKNYADAKSMIQEVLRERPESARAHLLNAYLLVHVDKNKVAANAELQTAVGLDKKGDVKSSALFGRTVAEIDMLPAKAVQTPREILHQDAINVQNEYKMLVKVLLFFLLVVGIIWLIHHIMSRRVVAIWNSGSDFHNHGGSSSPLPYSPAPASGGAYYPHAVTPMVVAQSNPQMGAFGTAASVAGGVVAGNMLSDALLHRHHSHGSEDSYSSPRRASQESTPSTYSEPSPVSYQNERSSYSSGSDSSWGSSDSSSSSSSWSSDSGSSSSSDW